MSLMVSKTSLLFIDSRGTSIPRKAMYSSNVISFTETRFSTVGHRMPKETTTFNTKKNCQTSFVSVGESGRLQRNECEERGYPKQSKGHLHFNISKVYVKE